MTFTRTLNDDYPIPSTISLNGERIDITNDIIKFSYKNADNAVKTIVGVPDTDGGIGDVLFFPNTDNDFKVFGIFQYDIERVDSNGYTGTHDSGILLLNGEVTP